MVDKEISKAIITKKIRRYKTSYGKMFSLVYQNWYTKFIIYEYQMTLVILNKILICLV